jgi:hypothetical protein
MKDQVPPARRLLDPKAGVLTPEEREALTHKLEAEWKRGEYPERGVFKDALNKARQKTRSEL